MASDQLRSAIGQNGSGVAITIVVIAVGAVIMYTMVSSIGTSSEMQQYMNSSQEWCDEHGGELYNSQTLGEHGGLHCEIDENTTVHMHEVAAENFTRNWTLIHRQVIDPYENRPWYMVGMMPVLLTSLGVVGVALVSSFGYRVISNE